MPLEPTLARVPLKQNAVYALSLWLIADSVRVEQILLLEYVTCSSMPVVMLLLICFNNL
jgi:hypothetical protein